MLQFDEYLRLIAELKQLHTLHSIAQYKGGGFNSKQLLLNAVEFASANLRHLLTDIPLAQHESILTQALFSKAIAELDESNGFVLDSATVHDPGGWLALAREQPVIFCSFHYGSYRLINYLLARADLKFAVLASRDIWETKRARFLGYHTEAQRYFSKSLTRMDVVNVEAPSTALALTRKVRAGWSLLAYIDGDNGVLGVGRHDSKMLRTMLLGQPLFARKGVAFLSHFLRAPVVPVICRITGPVERDITVHDPVYPLSESESRDVYCQAVTDRLYALLGEYLRTDPGQWERWFDIQTALDTDAIAMNCADDDATEKPGMPEAEILQRVLGFNHERFGVVQHAGQKALLDKDTYKLLSLPSRIMALLESYRVPSQVLSEDLRTRKLNVLRELMARQILCVVS